MFRKLSSNETEGMYESMRPSGPHDLVPAAVSASNNLPTQLCRDQHPSIVAYKYSHGVVGTESTWALQSEVFCNRVHV
jgi:hypothetical protein